MNKIVRILLLIACLLLYWDRSFASGNSHNGNIVFADDLVKAICVENWDTNGDGELSYDEAAYVTDLGGVFRGKDITQFYELNYFTGLTVIGEGVFDGCHNLVSIIIPNNVTTIAQYAFYDDNKLENISLPSKLNSIEKRAFARCSSLKSVTCHAFSPPVLGENVFYMVSLSDATLYVKPRRVYHYTNDEVDNVTTEWGAFGTITELTWPKSYELSENGRTLVYWYGKETSIDMTANPELNEVRVIGENAFYNDDDLEIIVFPEKLRIIGESAFFYSDALHSVTIPLSVERIEGWAFAGCSSMTDVVVLNPKTTLGQQCFRTCTSLTNVQLPADLRVLPERVFGNCWALESITLPERLTTISNSAFYGCRVLASITIPNYVTNIGNEAFMNCQRLLSVTSLPVIPPTLGSDVFYGVPQSSATLHVRRRSSSRYNDGDESEPSEWKNFGTFLADAEDDTRFILSEDGSTLVWWLSEEADVDMTADNELSEVTAIGSRAFDRMVNLTHLVLSDGLTRIGEMAFSWCENLTDFIIPESVNTIEDYSFRGCERLTSISLPPNLTNVSKGLFGRCRNLKEVWIPDRVTSIGESAFYSCDSLKSIILPKSLRSLGKNVFYDCKALSTVFMPDQVNSFGEELFRDCKSLTSFSLPSALTSLPRSVFQDCTNLRSVVLPPSLTIIGNRAFASCDSLRYIEVPRTVIKIDEYAFSSCDSLKQVVFQGIHSLEQPPSLTTIENYAFNQCYGLQSIELPATVSSIGKQAFRYCANLRSFVCHSITPPTLGEKVFLRMPQAEATLYVPENSISDYANADQWNEFCNREALVVEWEKTETLAINEVVSKIYNTMVMVKGKAGHGIRPFQISKYEVTQDIWQAVMEANPASLKDDEFPVDNVSWDDCQTFLNNLNVLSDLTFRLPTEEEWEYAAQGGTLGLPTTFAGGDDIDAIAWYKGNASGQIHLTGSKQANETGLFDMTGNVEEWTQTETSGRYVAKGGNYNTTETNAVLTGRNTYTPDTRRAGLGFRLVLDAPTMVTDPKVLVILTHDGTETTYYLRKLPKVTVENDELVVKAERSTVRFPIFQIRKMTYKPTDPVPT